MTPPDLGASGTVREELVLERIDRARRARPRVTEDRITMSHGAGGNATRTLIEAVFLDAFQSKAQTSRMFIRSERFKMHKRSTRPARRGSTLS